MPASSSATDSAEGPAVPDTSYIATALAVAIAITVTLRALPFALKRAMKDSALLADVGRWMPLGAITILAVYCLARIEVTTAPHGLPEIVGVTTTVTVHWWGRNAVLSIVSGTVACVLMSNLVVPT